MTLTTDVWAFGCVLLMLVTSKQPYSGVDSLQIPGLMNRDISPLDYLMEQGEYKIIDKNPDLRNLL